MACCLMAPSHYLNQSWLIIKGVLWHSSASNFTRSAHELNLWHVSRDYTFRMITTSPRDNKLIRVLRLNLPMPYRSTCICYAMIWRLTLIDCLAQNCSNSVANTLELQQSCAKPSICNNLVSGTWINNLHQSTIVITYPCPRNMQLFQCKDAVLPEQGKPL